MSQTPKLIETLKQYVRVGEHKWQFIFSTSKKKKGQCKVIYCRRLARVQVRREAGKLRIMTNSVCTTCECRLIRANNPAREAYRQIKERARRRKQIFDISFADFCAIPRFDEYLSRRGRGLDELHLDRVKVHLGYVPGNLEVITAAENLRKQREVDHPF